MTTIYESKIPYKILQIPYKILQSDNDNDDMRIRYGDNDVKLIIILNDPLYIIDHRSVVYLIPLQIRFFDQQDSLSLTTLYELNNNTLSFNNNDEVSSAVTLQSHDLIYQFISNNLTTTVCQTDTVAGESPSSLTQQMIYTVPKTLYICLNTPY